MLLYIVGHDTTGSFNSVIIGICILAVIATLSLSLSKKPKTPPEDKWIIIEKQ